MSDLDVAIVGGGISGLAVADGLVRAGRSVKVFEARPRLGGRIDSAEVADGGWADLGPTWFWPGERRVERLVEDLGVGVHPQWNTGDALMMVEGRPTRAGGFAVPPAHRFVGGAMALIDGLARRLPDGLVELNCAIAAIRPTSRGVELDTPDGPVTAAAAVVALPPALAVDRKLVNPADLDPELAAAAATIPVWMGAITKAVAVYPDPFWRADGLSGMVSALGAPFREIHDMSGPGGDPGMLFGFGQSEPGGRSLTAELFVEQLTTLFGSKAATPSRSLAVDWRIERYTTPDRWPLSMRYDLFGSPLFQRATWEGRLHWSSTETGTTAPGHIEGALAAAERTVAALAG